MIRAGHFDLVDWQNVAEEIESLGTSDRRELGHRLEVLMMHLLKWQFQPMHRSRSWREHDPHPARPHRAAAESKARACGGRWPRLSEDHYALARDTASAETGFAAATFPESLPYTPEQILQDDFFPGPIDDET